MLAYLFLRIDYASGYDPPGSKFTRIDFFVTPAFDEDTESIKAYVERAKIFFMANYVPEEKQAVVFLSCIGGKT